MWKKTKVAILILFTHIMNWNHSSHISSRPNLLFSDGINITITYFSKTDRSVPFLIAKLKQVKIKSGELIVIKTLDSLHQSEFQVPKD